ncbi:MAG: radical SAM protein, partial [Spirochaetia bacterium]|nr:radical SAM protein [Spirochaetia bacterium]
MITSKYTFTTRRRDTGGLLLLNYLSGAMDHVEKDEEPELLRRMNSGDWDGYPLLDHMLSQGYVFPDQKAHDQMVRQKYLEFQKEYDDTAVQLIFSVTYACNFACPYCFQEEYAQNKGFITRDITDAFFSYAEKEFTSQSRKPYITLFGGEPLPGAPALMESVLYFLNKADSLGYEVAIVTNGYSLLDYVPIFKERGYKIREIQTSLDGDREHHDQHRVTKNGKATFDRIADGIDAALQAGFRINLRSILDKRN